MKVKETFHTWRYTKEKIRSWEVVSYCCEEFKDFLDQFPLMARLNEDNSISAMDVEESFENFRFCPHCGKRIEVVITEND